jgi:hypothetical protein
MIVKLQLISELHKSMLGFLMNKLRCNNVGLIISEGKKNNSLFQCMHWFGGDEEAKQEKNINGELGRTLTFLFDMWMNRQMWNMIMVGISAL